MQYIATTERNMFIQKLYKSLKVITFYPVGTFSEVNEYIN